MASTKTPQTIVEAVEKLLKLRIGTRISIRRAYDDWWWRQFWADKKRSLTVTNQRLLLEEHKDLGSELAAARFVVTRAGGRVRTQDGIWLTRTKELPKKLDQSFKLTYIDLSDVGLMTEGIDNLIGLKHIEALDLSRNPSLDDFACDMLARQFRHSKTLKEINLSFSPYVSIYGLDILFRIPSLRRLAASSTLASNHEQAEVFKIAAEVERGCEVILD